MATTVTLKPNAIDLSGSTSGTTTLQATAVAGTTTITLPAATDTLVGRATTDTLTNKTLTTPVISSLSSASATALTLQSSGTTAITVDTSQRVAFVAGTAALPAITTDGDTNTGIFFPAADTIAFSEGGAEAMRIDSSGNLLVGTTTYATTPTQGMTVANTTSASVNIGHTTGTPSGFLYVNFGFNAGQIGSITQNGTTAVAYNTTSDYRLKENIAPLTGALARITALKPVTYTWKTAPDEMGEGFIAHELAEVCPQAVTGEKDEIDKDGNPKYQGIDTSFLVATLTAALQETKALIDTQAETINALTARIVALENK